MVNQLLVGVHIATIAKSLAFGARLGFNIRISFDIISNNGGEFGMFENHGPHMWGNDNTLHFALVIFVRDLGIVTHENSTQKFLLHISISYIIYYGQSLPMVGIVKTMLAKPTPLITTTPKLKQNKKFNKWP